MRIHRPTFVWLPASGSLALITAMALLLALLTPAQGLINPDFTPIDLVRQSPTILRLDVASPAEDAQALPVQAVTAIKGQAPETLRIHFGDSSPAVVDGIRRATRGDGAVPAMMLAGDFSGAAMADTAGLVTRQPQGALYLGLTWYALFSREDGGYDLGEDTLDLKAVWAGGVTMLERATRLALADPRTELPTVVGASWGDDIHLGSFGDAHGLLVIEGDRPGGQRILVLSRDGDRILERDEDGDWTDRTSARRLTSRSHHAAWIIDQGRGTLASWNGKTLGLHAPGAGGNFTATPIELEIEGTVVGLTGLGGGEPRQSLIVVSRADAAPLIVARTADGWQARPLTAETDVLGEEPFPAGPSLAADLTGDGHVDIVQTLRNGLVLYRGLGNGRFAPAMRSVSLALRDGVSGIAAGDFDGDGRLDLLTASSVGSFMLINRGDGRFEELMGESGEPEYLARPGAVGLATMDINSDGRQDFILVYGNMGAHIYFNRGFRTFGYSITLELADSESDAAEALIDGQRAFASADLDGNGVLDTIWIDGEGEGWIVALSPIDRRPLALEVALPPGVAGPVTVRASEGRREMGSRLLQPGRVVRFGRYDRGPIDLEWRYPGGEIQRHRVVMLSPSRFTLPAPQ